VLRVSRETKELTAERDKLRMLWEGVDSNLKSLRHYETTKGGQQAGIPHWHILLKCPSVRVDLEWYCREALKENKNENH
jgi:hypothetical protein